MVFRTCEGHPLAHNLTHHNSLPARKHSHRPESPRFSTDYPIWSTLIHWHSKDTPRRNNPSNRSRWLPNLVTLAGSSTSIDPSTISAIVRGILDAYLSFLETPFDLPVLGRAPYYLYLSVLFWIAAILVVFAKAIAIFASIGRKR